MGLCPDADIDPIGINVKNCRCTFSAMDLPTFLPKNWNRLHPEMHKQLISFKRSADHRSMPTNDCGRLIYITYDFGLRTSAFVIQNMPLSINNEKLSADQTGKT